MPICSKKQVSTLFACQGTSSNNVVGVQHFDSEIRTSFCALLLGHHSVCFESLGCLPLLNVWMSSGYDFSNKTHAPDPVCRTHV